KGLLDTARRYPHGAIAAEVRYIGRDPFSQKVFINKGLDAGIKAGDAVIDAFGAVGQVTSAYPTMGEVWLLAELAYAVLVMMERSEEPAENETAKKTRKGRRG